MELNKYEIEFYSKSFMRIRISWRWKIKSKQNGKIIAASSEGFWNYMDCVHNLQITGKAINEMYPPNE